MEEKGTVKIRLSTFFLIFALIVIIIIGYFMYKLYKDNETAKTNVAELNSQVSGLESTINDLQGTLNNISESSNGNSSKAFSNAEIKNSIQNYLDLISSRDGTPEQVILDLGLMSRIGVYTDRTDDNFIRTDIKYSEFKNKILDYMTEQWYEEYFNRAFEGRDWFRNENGYLYFFDGGASGMYFEVKSVTLKGNNSDSVYIANVELQDGEIDASKWPVVDIEFHTSNYNGKCVISYCNF